MRKEPLTATTTGPVSEAFKGCNGKPINSKGAKQGLPPRAVPPDPEVFEKPVRRRFTAAYKLGILHAADACAEAGQLGALLRREGLYSSHLTTWRRQREQGILEALAPKKRGRKAQEISPLARRVAELERDKQQLEQRLKQAEIIIEIQKKVSALLEMSPQSSNNGAPS
jgi:transposase